MRSIKNNQTDFAWKTKIELPHLRATVGFADLTKLKGVPEQGSAYTTLISESPDKDILIGVFIKDINKSIKIIGRFPMIAHEVVHVLQILCEHRMMTAEKESEHLAYITSYLLEELLK